MAAFNALLTVPILLKNQKLRLIVLGLLLLVPAIYSIKYQTNLKQYDALIETLSTETQVTDDNTHIYTHSFIDFSKKVLIPNDSLAQELLIPLYQFPKVKSEFPQKLKVLIYDYYQHAYPEEQVDVDAISEWLEGKYRLTSERKVGNVSLYEYERQSDSGQLTESSWQ
jgi:hypothetical protein